VEDLPHGQTNEEEFWSWSNQKIAQRVRDLEKALIDAQAKLREIEQSGDARRSEVAHLRELAQATMRRLDRCDKVIESLHDFDVKAAASGSAWAKIAYVISPLVFTGMLGYVGFITQELLEVTRTVEASEQQQKTVEKRIDTIQERINQSHPAGQP